jgi:hypothetical protein
MVSTSIYKAQQVRRRRRRGSEIKCESFIIATVQKGGSGRVGGDG